MIENKRTQYLTSIVTICKNW